MCGDEQGGSPVIPQVPYSRALAHSQGLVQVHLADVAGQVGDSPAGTARHRRGGVGRHHGPQAGEVDREAVEESGILHAEQFSTS